MKFRPALVGMLLVGTSLGLAQPAQPPPVYTDDGQLINATPTPTPTPTPKPTAKPTTPPPKKAGPTPTPTPRKKEEAAKIEGTVINRTVGGGVIGFNFVGNNIVLTFFDAKKKKANVDVDRAIVRWEMKRKTGDDRAIFAKADAFTMTSPKMIPPPHTIRFTLLLFKEGSDQAVETYIVTPTS